MENSEKKNWKERIKAPYRLVIMNEETFEEISSYKLTLLNVYILLSTLVVVTAALVVFLIIFTPIKKYIPGYGSAGSSRELMRLNREVEKLEKQITADSIYIDNFKKILVGDIEPPQGDEAEGETFDDSLLNVERIAEDEQLRQEIKLEEIRQISQNSTSESGEKELPLEQLYFSSPLSGEISAGFMPDKSHYGVDVLAPKNSAIKAAMDGVVIQSDWTLETGNTIGIQHANNLITFYKHNSSLLKKVGSKVKAGEAVAIIGNTGTLSDGPHLHFELWYRGRPLNPVDYILF
ncbi:MAG: M23 family metallopeptidase [Saprospiraceae bacterium]